uniref:Flagellar hook-length control protein-like C-terminal domain-containing protein n=1 Tax=Caulobacter sp. (strain K31) TaxID=366602 RepID=B0SZ05_CAUSK
MPIFSIAPLSPLTPSNPINRADLAADLARVALIQTTETLGAMIDQSQSHSDTANLGNDAVGEGEASRAKAAEARGQAASEIPAETPARAVSVAAGRAAARQAGLAPLMADMTQAAAEPDVPRPVKAAIAQVMALGARMDGQISGPEIRQALQRSGLFLEARLAAAAAGVEPQRAAAGTLTAPPRIVPAPTPNSDMKAALLVFREVVKTWMETTPPTSAQVGTSSPSASTPPGQAATAAAASAQFVDRGSPQALAAAPAFKASSDEVVSKTPVPTPPATEDGPPGLTRPAAGWPNVNTPSPPAPRPAAPPPLPAFGAIVADDFPPLPLTSSRTSSAAAMAYGGPEVAPGPPSQTPPPYAGAPTHAQAAAQPGLPVGADPHAIGHRLLTETNAALARTELLQIASLPDAPAAGRPVEDHGQRWVFDMPFMTPQGPAAAQFEISRDGGGSGGEGGRASGRTWRARFSLDVEPMGPVHAQVALTGDRARVSLWAERPASMARLRGGEERLNSALREAALEPELAFHAGQPRAPAAAPGQFLDQAT